MKKREWLQKLEEQSPTHFCRVEYPPKELKLGQKPFVVCAEKIYSRIGEEEELEEIPTDLLRKELELKLVTLDRFIMQEQFAITMAKEKISQMEKSTQPEAEKQKFILERQAKKEQYEMELKEQQEVKKMMEEKYTELSLE